MVTQTYGRQTGFELRCTEGNCEYIQTRIVLGASQRLVEGRQQLGRRRSGVWIWHERSVDEGAHRCCHWLHSMPIALHRLVGCAANTIVELLDGRGAEGGAAVEHLICHRADGPQIDGRALVRNAAHKLRRHIEQVLVALARCEAKIAQLDGLERPVDKEQVRRLDVAVRDAAVGVQVVERLADLAQDRCRRCLEHRALVHDTPKRAARAVFENCVHDAGLAVDAQQQVGHIAVRRGGRALKSLQLCLHQSFLLGGLGAFAAQPPGLDGHFRASAGLLCSHHARKGPLCDGANR
eukprot:6192556-Pleurochrysis_carterae.AAC.1